MASDLGSVDRKVEWAEHHIGQLEAQLRVFGRGRPYEIVTQKHPEDPKRSQMVLRIRKSIPDSIVLRVADAIHNLRSSLDHLAFQAVTNGGGAVAETTAFPICRNGPPRTPNDFKSLVLGKVHGAPGPIIEEMLGLQPYEGGSDEHLWCLHYLDIVDKHRLMLSAFASYESVNIDFGAWMRETFPENAPGGLDPSKIPSMVLGIRPEERYPLYDGYVLYEAPTEEITKGNPKFTIEESLGEPKVLEGKPVVPMLTDLVKATRSTIDLFRPLL